MDVHETKLRNGQVQHIKDLAIHLRLVRGLFCRAGCRGRRGIAAFRVEVVDQLTKDDTEQRKWNARGNGADDAGDEQDEIEFCRAGAEIDREVVEEVLQLWVEKS